MKIIIVAYRLLTSEIKVWKKKKNAMSSILSVNCNLSDLLPCHNMAQDYFMVEAAHESRHARQVQKFLSLSAILFWDASETK